MSHVNASIVSNVAPEGAPSEAPEAAPVATVIEGAPGAPSTAPSAPPKLYNAKAGASDIDYMRCRIANSAVARVNAALSFTEVKTVKQLEAQCDCRTVGAHLSWALKNGYVVRVAQGAYLRAPSTREAPSVDAMSALTAPPAVVDETAPVAPPEAPPAVETAPEETKKEKKARIAREKKEAARIARETAQQGAPIEAPADEAPLVETGAETQCA